MGNATVNGNNNGAATAQEVVVRAFDRTDLEGITITGAISSGGTNTLAAQVDVVKKVVLAQLAGTIKSQGGVEVKAAAWTDLDVAVMDVGIAQGVGAGGSVGVSVVSNKVAARIASGADIQSQANIVVAADGETTVSKLVGRAGVGGVAAVGAGVGVDVISNRIEASIGTNAQSDARGLSRFWPTPGRTLMPRQWRAL